MKALTTFIIMILSTIIMFSGNPPRKPFIIIKINGKTYKNGSEVIVRPGERITAEAILMGGRRDYCSNPQKYANVGRNTIIESYGENGMSFSINNGQFKGKWSLTEEAAIFTSANNVKITSVKNGIISRISRIKIPQSDDYSKIYLKVKSKTKWHYVKHTPAGKSEKNKENEAFATVYLILKDGSGFDDNTNETDTTKTEEVDEVWYSSRNIIAKGMENFTVRNELNEVQKFYNLIEKYLLKNDQKNCLIQIQNLKNYVNEVKRAINDAKQKNPEYNCKVTLIGLPTDLSMEHLNKLEVLKSKWKERFLISQVNSSKINDLLLQSQMGFSANVLKSVIKNYVNWGSGLPTGVENILTIYDPKNIFGVIDLPRNVLAWYQDAENDAGILKNQVMNIKRLTELRNFYLDNSANSVKESKKLHEIIKDFDFAKKQNTTLEQYFKSISGLNWVKK